MNSRTVIGIAIGSLVLLMAVSSCSMRPGSGRSGDEDARVQAVRENTLGVAYMNQQRSEDALALFRQAVATDSSLTIARLNQAVALRSLQRFDEALEILVPLTEDRPDLVEAWYNLGLTYRNLGETESAARAFAEAARLDPTDPDAQYLLGSMQAQLGRHDEAIASFLRTVELFPFHASAEYGLARSYLVTGRSDEAEVHAARFQELSQSGLGVLMGEGYGEQGRYSLAGDVSDLAETAPDPVDVRLVSVADDAGLDFVHSVAAGSGGGEGFLGGGACFLDYDGDGWTDVFLTSGGAVAGVLYRNLENGGFERVWDTAATGVSGPAMGCAAGDYDNDEMTDLAVSLDGGTALLRNDGAGGFEDVSSAAGLDALVPSASALGLSFVDFDHDGDLDLYVARPVDFELGEEGPIFERSSRGPGNVLWRNNGNGTFLDWTSETALAGALPGVGVLASDLNNDRAVDLVVSGGGPVPEVFLNPREGAFSRLDWSGAFPGPTSGILAADFDKDGWMDLAFGHWGAPGVSVWRNTGGSGFERVMLPDPGWNRGWGLTALDYDNDGWIDLAAAGETAGTGEIRIFRNRGTAGFEDRTVQVGLAGLPVRNPRSLVSADYDSDGDRDLLLTENGGPVVLLRNDGGNRNSWLGVRLEGLNDSKSAFGTKVEVFAGTLRQKLELQPASGYLGQSAAPLTLGLGPYGEADTVRMLWPTGVPQDEVQLQARQDHSILEIDRRGSSCPVLFAWNGETYAFITDVIGAGVVGHWVGPGQRNVSDPTEYIKVPGSSVRLRNGRLSFRLAEPMEELVYLDEVRLLAVDHPDGVEVYPNEYFAAAPPFPEFETIAAAEPRLPAGAWDDAGRDVLDLLRERDRRYVAGFDSTAFKGFARSHSLELDLGEIPPGRRVRLLLDGYVDYFSATSVYAAHQAGVEAVLPYVEALDPSGGWVRVMDDFGFPAGLARTMTRDITGRLPAGARRIRITTNLEVYWDRIRIDTSAGPAPVRLHAVPLASGSLSFLGYPRAVEGPSPGDVSYVYADLSATGPYARHAGYHTRFGEVGHLLTDADDRFAIFGSGEEVALEFDPSGLPEPEDGWTRDYFFYADGFAKDMDFYEAHAYTVGPLPFHTVDPYPYPPGAAYPEDLDHWRYRLEENTRSVSGGLGSLLRFDH